MGDKERIWQGGTNNQSIEKERAIREWNKMIRDSEDYVDTVDIEKDFNPRDNINKNMDKPAEISGGEPRNRYRRPEGAKVGKK